MFTNMVQHQEVAILHTIPGHTMRTRLGTVARSLLSGHSVEDAQMNIYIQPVERSFEAI